MNRDGYVYILSNKSMPGLVKIGKSRRGGRHRAEEIYQTGVPTPFHLEYEVYTHDCGALEQTCHDYLQNIRVNDSREFFNLEVSEAIIKLTDIFLEEYDHEVVCSDLGELAPKLHEIMVRAGIPPDNFGDAITMYQALSKIDPAAIKAAFNERQAEIDSLAAGNRSQLHSVEVSDG